MKNRINRRTFIKSAAATGAAVSIMPSTIFASRAQQRVKMGFIGTGMRGQWVLWLAAKYPEVDIPAICDIDDGMIESALKILKDADKPEPKIYKNGD
ncbi:MAG: twin-arginine translocation signal domain-containing protein, partial [Candidatus Marinimicrobia bacterium]|nr:twin-arginine translocation signal domain-containing protein [Candidatus Neomarinimicrobiota bacterium]